MKENKILTGIIGFLLGISMALGMMGCLTTAFSLPLENFEKAAVTCGLVCLVFTFFFSFRYGWIGVLLAAAGIIGYQWRLGRFWEELCTLVYRISQVYNNAYHWGVLQLGEISGSGVDLPITALGSLLGGTAVWSVCRGKGGSLPVCLSLFPLLTCVVVTDTSPAPRWFFLLVLSQVMLILTGSVRREDPRQGNRLAVYTAVPVVLALGALFLLMPQEGYESRADALRERLALWVQDFARQENWGTETEIATVERRPVTPDNLNLATLGSRRYSPEAVLDVAAENGGTLYLRGQDYDVYDGRSWRATGNRVEEFGCEGVNLGYVVVETRQELGELYLPYYPRDTLKLIGGKYENLRITQDYSFVRFGLPEDWQTLAAAGETGRSPGEEYLALPEETLAEAQGLLSSILEGTTTRAEKAQAIADYVRQAAVYDRNPNTMRSDAPDFALWFLEEGERGYCVHFATAAAVLLRAAGLEARYVSGYMVNAESGQTVTATGENAHAWAEYYEPGLQAWLIVEATPGEGQPGASPETQETEEPTSEPTEATRPETVPAQTPDQTQSPEPEPSEQVPESSLPQQEEPAKPLPVWVKQMAGVLITLTLCAGALEGQYRLRILLRRWDQHRGSPNRMALRRWREVEHVAKLLHRKTPENLKNLALKARFSQHTITDEELDAFDQWLAQGRADLKVKSKLLIPVYRYVFAEV